MSKPTVQQIAGINILDWLYFNQVLIFSAFSYDDFLSLTNILKRVVAEVKKEVTGMEAEIMTHYVLCFLEVMASDERDNLPEVPYAGEVDRHYKTYFQRALHVQDELMGNNCAKKAFAIASKLVADVLSAPMVVRYRLAERCLAVEYADAAQECLMWLAESGAVICSKYKDGKPTPAHKFVVARIVLLVEFELLKSGVRTQKKDTSLPKILFEQAASETSSHVSKNLIREAGELWEEKHYGSKREMSFKAFSFDRLFEKKDVADFLKRADSHWTRPRLYLGPTGSLVGILATITMVRLKFVDDPEKPTPIYNDYNNEGTLTFAAEGVMKSYGLHVAGRTIYLRYKEFNEDLLPLIKVYYVNSHYLNVVLGAENEDIAYFSMCTFTKLLK